jgi:hypothetical protein
LPQLINLSLSYSGETAENHQLDFYDAAQALIGFERSIALTAHLAINGTIITQAPSLKGAKIVVAPPIAGSWEIVATIISASGGTAAVGAALYKLGTAPRDTPLGHLISSLYDYAVRRTLGFPVDYNQTLGAQYEASRRQTDEIAAITPERVDSLVEKIEPAVKMMHRPIVESRTATSALIEGRIGGTTSKIGRQLTHETYERMQLVERSRAEDMEGRVSSYNINTFRGRMYIDEQQRPIPFELSDSARDDDTIAVITRSLSLNASKDFREGDISFRAFRITTPTGRLKTLIITDVD